MTSTIKLYVTGVGLGLMKAGDRYPPAVAAMLGSAQEVLRLAATRKPTHCHECVRQIAVGADAWRLDYNGNYRSARWCRPCVDTMLAPLLIARALEIRAERDSAQTDLAHMHVAFDALRAQPETKDKP